MSEYDKELQSDSDEMDEARKTDEKGNAVAEDDEQDEKRERASS